MKRYFFIFLLIIIVISCKSKTEKVIEDTTIVSNLNDTETQKLIAEFKPIIEGIWVKKDYIDEVVKTKSPLKAFNLSGLTMMGFDTRAIKGDSLIFSVGYNNHEGGNLIAYFKPGKILGSIVIGPEDIVGTHYQLKYTIKKDTTLTLFSYNKDKLLDSAMYIRPFKTNNLVDGTDYLVNKGLISGNYNLVDSLGRVNKITFSNEGVVTGFNQFKTYKVALDFMTPPNNVDEITFDMYSDQQISYAFQIKKDTLKLFETVYSTDSLELIIEKLKYKLVRKR